MFCAFCYKTIDPDHEKLRNDGTLLTRFVVLVQRYFGKKFQVKTEPLEEFKSCMDCNFLIESFCNLYHELKCLELRMEWKVRKLLQVISAAERVPSRIKLAKQFFKNERLLEQSGCEDVFKVICEFRKDFKRECRKHLSNSFPQVVIPHPVNKTSSSTDTNQAIICTGVKDPFEISRCDKMLLGWISTLVGVFWLGFSCWENALTTTEKSENHVPSAECCDDDNDNTSKKSMQISSSSPIQNHPISDVAAQKVKISAEQSEEISASPSKINTTPQLTCELCQKVVHTKKKLQYHKLSAHMSRDQWPFSCSLCDRQFLGFYDFERHNKTLRHQMRKSLTKVRKSKSSKLLATTSSRIIVKIEKEDSHTNEVKNEADDNLCENENNTENFPVSPPENETSHETRLLRPLRHTKRPLNEIEDESCSEASSLFENHDEDYSKEDSSDASESDRSSLIHSQLKKRQPSYICEAHGCSESFVLPEELDIHKKLHGSFRCQFCDKVENYAPKLALHEMAHSESNSESRWFQCARCPYWAALKQRYVNHHLRRHLNLSRGTFICTICKIPLTRTGRRDHMRTHHKTEGVDESTLKNCEQCPAFFLAEAQLLKHMKIAHQCGSESSVTLSSDADGTSDSDLGTIFSCQICNTPYMHETSLIYHERKVHGIIPPEKPKKPVPKPKRKQRKATFKKVKIRQSPVKSLRKHICDFPKCTKSFELPETLELHKKQHGTFSCSVCDVVETFAPKLALHELTHPCALADATQRKESSAGKAKTRKTLPVLNCVRCPYSTKLKGSYIEHHLEVHLGIPLRIMECPICKCKRSDLRKHHKYHHNIDGIAPEEVAKCDKCPAYFCRYIQLISHQKRMHGYDPLKCLDCGKTLKNQDSLQKHGIHIHKKASEEFQFVCDNNGCEGDKRFETRIALEWHKIHTHSQNKGGDILICSQCGKKCWTEVALNNHMRVHDENRQRLLKEKRKEKKHVCDLCGKAFLIKAALDVHKLSHSGPSSWKYCCLICEKKCQSEEKLDQHLRTHTREKPYFCQFCEEEYGHAHNLRNHMNKQHGANVVARKYNPVYLESRKGKKLKTN